MVLDCSGHRRRRLPERAASNQNLSPRLHACRPAVAWRCLAHVACARYAIGLAVLIAVAGCDSSSTTTGPSPTKCQVALTAPPTALAGGGGTGTVSVSTQPECAWSARADASWISGLSPASGQGNGQVSFEVPANPQASARQGAIAVNDNRVSIDQEGMCTFEVTPLTQSVAAGGGTGSVTVTTAAGCAWTSSSNAPWITVTSGEAGTESGSVGFSVSTNADSERTGTITIAGQTVTVTQSAASSQCSYTVSPMSWSISASGGTGAPVAVSASGGCAWTATSNAAWITITSGAKDAGRGSVVFTVAANTGAQRTGTLSIAGKTFRLTQEAPSTPESPGQCDTQSRL